MESNDLQISVVNEVQIFLTILDGMARILPLSNSLDLSDFQSVSFPLVLSVTSCFNFEK